jgi:hypothetical protein
MAVILYNDQYLVLNSLAYSNYVQGSDGQAAGRPGNLYDMLVSRRRFFQRSKSGYINTE